MRALAAVACLLLASCSGDVEPSADPEPTPSASRSHTPAPVLFPRGFPKKVPVASLPEQVRSWYEGSGTRWAVALAPGVWAQMPPGATMVDALTAGVYDGFCGSVEAYSRKFRDGEEFAGTCW